MSFRLPALLTFIATTGLVRMATAQADAARAYPAQIAAAEKSLELDDARELRRWLDVTAPRDRAWEWDYLNAVADTTERKVHAPAAPIRIAISPGGDTIATVEGSLVKLWSWPALEPIRTIEGHESTVYRAEFSPDGARLITVARDQTSRTWDLATGREIAHIELPDQAFAAVAFSPDGALAATCAWERVDGQVYGVVWIWNPTTGEIAHRQRVGVKPLSSIRFTPDGSRLLAGSWDGLVHVLDLSAQETARLPLPDEGIYNAVNDIAVSPDGRFVAAASKDRTTRIFEIASGELVATLRGHTGWVEGALFSHDGSQLATTSIDTSVRLWNTSDWSPAATLRGAAETVRGAVWSNDDGRIVAASLSGDLLVWDAHAPAATGVAIRSDASGTYSAALNPDGSTVAVACYDGTLRLYDAHSGQLVDFWKAHPESTCHAACFSADGSRLATCSWDKTTRVWRMPEHAEPIVLDAGSGVYSCALSPDGSRAALTAGSLQIWDVDQAALLHDLKVEGAGSSRAEFSHDGRLVASGWRDGAARIYNTTTGELVATLQSAKSGIETVAFSDDDSLVITGDSSGVVRAYALAGGEPVFERHTGGNGVNHVAVSGKRIAVGTDQLWIIDLDHGDIVLGLKPQEEIVWHLTWSRDGKRIATVGNCFIAILGSEGRGAEH